MASNPISLLHPLSQEAMHSEMDFFTIPFTARGIERSTYVYYQPISAIDGTDVIEFTVPGVGDHYLDLDRTILEVTGKFVDPDGTALDDTKSKAFYPVNLLMHALWKQVDVTLNQHQVARGSQTYPYKAYIEKLLNFSADTKENNLTACMWYTDTPGYFSDTAANNKGGGVRQKLVEKSTVIQMMDKLHLDIFNTNRFLINNVTMKLKLQRSPTAFYIIRADNTATPVFKITNIQLKVCKVKPTNNLLLAHGALLLKNVTAKYPINNTELKIFNFPKGASTLNVANVFLGSIPNRVVIGLVLNSAMNGDTKHNPFFFRHCNISYLVLTVDGVQFPSRPYQPDFGTNQYLPCYHDMLECLGKLGRDKNNGISYESYGKGNTLFVFDLTPSMTANSGQFHLIRQGSLALEIRCSEALSDNMSVILYGESDRIMEIDAARTVALDFST